MLELDVTNAEGLFNLLDREMTGEISFEDFLRGVMRLKGHARSLDMVSMMRANDRIHFDVQQLALQVGDLFQELCGHEWNEGASR